MFITFVVGVCGRAEPLPAVALDSRLVLALERTAIVGGLVAATGIFILRGWSGYFPSKVSTTGAEYAECSVLSEFARGDAATATAIVELRQRQRRFNTYLDEVASRLEKLEIHREDML
jgi:hypothetical protein